MSERTARNTYNASAAPSSVLTMRPLRTARAIRVEAASTGLRKPVNVIEGNYKLATGVCPWWDGVLRGEAAE